MDAANWALGHQDENDHHSPSMVGSGFASIESGSNFSVAIKTDGTLWTWGFNISGQLGNGANADVYTATQIGNGTTVDKPVTTLWKRGAAFRTMLDSW